MTDVILPLELLAYEKQGLESLQSGNVMLAPWQSKKDIPNLIEETKTKIQNLEVHIAKYGNEWNDE